MSHAPIRLLYILAIVLPILSVAVVPGCRRSDDTQSPETPLPASAQVLRGGAELRFAPRSPQLEIIETAEARMVTEHMEVSAPMHIAVSAVPSPGGERVMLLFENQDLTQLYFDLEKSASNLERADKNLVRVRDLAAHKAVPEKDLLDAETELSQLRTEVSEKESRLRAAGIVPSALRAAGAVVWAIAELPENQLASVRVGARAEVSCNAYSGETFAGTITAIGEVVDPTTRAVKVRISLPASAKLRPGIYGVARFSESAENAIVIPRSAVVNVQGNSYAFVLTGEGVFERRMLQIGGETADAFLVSAGVAVGERVASTSTVLLKGLSFGY
jgi:multidrug efflux pump subunit AcrA (membrane-fusion protein)